MIGAGASGLIAAGRAAELGGRVLLLDKMERAGRKLLITGKGRCNITNDAPMSDFFSHIYPNPKFLKHAFSGFFSADIIRILNRMGVETVTERGGRIFPASNSSADVVNALVRWVNKAGAETRYGWRAESLLQENGKIIGIKVFTPNGPEEISASNVIICTGGKSYPATGSDGDGYRLASSVGHTIETPRQALVPVETVGNIAARLQGLSLKNVTAAVWVNGKKMKEEFGEMLFTHFGLSGPIILTLSRFITAELRNGSRVEVTIDLKPALDEQKLDNRLLRDLDEHGKKKMENLFRLWLPSSMIPVFEELTGVSSEKPGNQLSSKERKKILLLMKSMRFKITGCRSFREAIITSGGVKTIEMDSKTMESKLVKGLYFAGEVIDLDADTGGFNLQIAFSTGWLAGQSAILSLSSPSQ